MNTDQVERLRGFWNHWMAERQEATEKFNRYLAMPEAQKGHRPGWLESQMQATDAYIIACTKCLTSLEHEIALWTSEN
jgi:hypothetical protein